MKIMFNNLKIAVAITCCFFVLLLTLTVAGIAAGHTDSVVVYAAPLGVMLQSMLVVWMLLRRVERRIEIYGVYPAMDYPCENRSPDITWPKQK